MRRNYRDRFAGPRLTCIFEVVIDFARERFGI
jgi:hypothetical protein